MSDYIITPQHATDLAQLVHNYIEENGSIDQEKVLDLVTEELSENIRGWLEDNIDWQHILDADESVREFAEERDQALNEIRAEALEGAGL